MAQEFREIGGYQVIEVIGKGGAGTIYLAYHQNLRKYVVLKQIGTRKGNVESLRRESDILKNLHHTYLPQIYDYIIFPDQVFTVMDYIDGDDLGKLPAGSNMIPEASLLRWFRQLADVLVYLEQQSRPVVHSDIKPSNIILRKNGDICLIDFNISFEENVEDGIQGLTRSFASPEQIYMASLIQSGIRPDFQLDARTDIYSIGATFYYLLTGRTAPGDTAVIPLSEYSGLPYSPGLLAIIDKCLRREREERFQSAKKLQKALQNLKKMDVRYKGYVALKAGSILASAALIALGAYMIATGLRLRVKEAFRQEVTALAQGEEDGASMEERALGILNNESYRQILVDSPDSMATIYRALGNAYYKERNFTEAAENYREALSCAKKTSQDLSLYYRDLGLACAYADDMDGAKSVLAEANSTGASSTALAQISLAIAISEKNESECLAFAARILEETANEPEVCMRACLSVADYYESEGQTENALSWLDRAENYAQDREILERRGAIFLRIMQTTRKKGERMDAAATALEIYHRLCEDSGALVSDRINVAIALRALENRGMALAELQKVLELDPDNCTANMYLAVINLEIGNSPGARAYAVRAMELYSRLSPEQQQAIDRNLTAAVREITGA